MKRIIIFIGVAFAIPCTAQWRDAHFGGPQVLAFGVHDSSFFISEAGPGYLVYRRDTIGGGVNGIGWAEADNGMDGSKGNVTSFASLGKYFFAGSGPTSTGNGYLSTDNGSTWTDPIGGPVGTNGTYVFGQYATRIARSRDSGKSWEHLSYPAGNSYAGNGACVFNSTSSGIWRSLDSGFTWTQISTPFTGTITVMGSLVFLTGRSKLGESTDNGSNWTTIAVDSAGVPVSVNCLATDGKNLFAGTTKGVFVSTDTGRSWSVRNEGIFGQYANNSTTITVLGIFDTLLFADEVSTEGQGSAYGLFDRPISELTKPPSAVQQPPQAATTLSVYPNPLTNTATISYTLAEAARVNITIYDALGKTVSVPVPGYEETTGEHEITYDARVLPSGTYWCHLSAGTVERVAKLVIEK